MKEFQTFYDDEQTGGTNPQQAQTQTQTPSDKGGVKPSEVLRALSNEYGVNLFDKNGVDALKEKFNKTTTDFELNKQTLATKETEIEALKSKYQDLEIKHNALGLGFPVDKLDDVIALAKVKTPDGKTILDGLNVVKEQYGHVFLGQKGAGSIGLNGTQSPLPKGDVEKYMANDPKYAKYYNKK